MSLFVSKFLKENYDRYYGQDCALSEWRDLAAIDKCANILRLCSDVKHDEILEVGCGDGAILDRLSRLGFGSRLAGLEISESAVHSAQQKTIPGVEIRLFDGYEMPFGPKQFDLAVLSHVLEHVEYPRKLVTEAARIARKVFVEVPLEDNRRLSEDFTFDSIGHINFYNVKTIRRLVRSCGMTILGGHLSHSSLPSYVYRKRKLKGMFSYLVKESGLRLLPSVVTSLFTYHYSLIYVDNVMFGGRP